MSWLDKIMSGHGKRAETAKEDSLEHYTKVLKTIVYDDDLVKELAPVFSKLHGVDGFDKVFELLETKEQQISAISGGDWHKQDSDAHQDLDKDEQEDEVEALSATEILELKYKQK